MSDDYLQRLTDTRQKKIRELLSALPTSCSDFIRSIHTTTSALTRLAYATDLGVFFDYAFRELPYFSEDTIAQIKDVELAHFTTRDIDGYSEYLSLYYKEDDEEKAYVNHEYGIMRKLSSLRSYFEYLYRDERITGNVASLVPLPKLHEKPILRLDPDEMTRLLDEVQTGENLTDRQKKWHEYTKLRDYAILMLFLGTGMRVSECVGVNLEDIDLKNGAVMVTRKGGNQVILYFPDEVSQAIDAYLEQRKLTDPVEDSEHALFLSQQRKRITQRAVQIMVKKYAAIVVPLKKRISPHKLRSTYATNLYNETGDIYLVADALGHSNVNTTRKHYAAMSDARRREAAKYVKLPREAEEDQPKKPE